ncbi:hypothetical protein [Phenylobacterium sp.]|uniref:hypothetical protein n=1 Tax=Phenylobacterium sp. TaxID=1871053 RepID=UPI0025FEEB89|nr:hypothetical protein [Phenylobacterium sp.]MBX3482548.1 hypothetical protein [Phenylobacterium sp.]MCW5758756.1 hypothetical protein [Phenylobacterium sp.]
MAFAFIEEVDAVATLTASTATDEPLPAWGDSPSGDYDIGRQVITPSTHQVWESAVDNNATDPLAPGPGHEEDWLLVGYTNRYRMYDQSPQSQTTMADSLAVTHQPGAYIKALALLEVDAATVTVQQHTEVTNELYSRTFDMISDVGIYDYDEYFFAPVGRRTDLYVNDLKPYAEASLTVIFESAAGEDVSCGVLKFGREIVIGNTQYGGRVGIEDYSVKQVDEFGQATILERAFNRTGDYTLILTPAQVDPAYTNLGAIRATPVVFVADPDYGACLLYGFLKDFAVEFAGPTHAYANISIKGLA